MDDFEVDQQATYLRDVGGNGVYLGGRISGPFDFEVFGKQIAYTGRPYFLNMGFNVFAIPEEFSSQWLDSECFVPFASIVPRVFDFSADGKSVIVFGQNRSDVRSKMSFSPIGRFGYLLSSYPFRPNQVCRSSQRGV